MNRRGFISGILSAAVAPAYVRFGSLMVPKYIVEAEKILELQIWELENESWNSSFFDYQKIINNVDTIRRMQNVSGYTSVARLQ